MASARLTGLELASPLDIPEILDRILSFVDKRTLACNVVLVSRRWFSAGSPHLTYEYAWSDCLEQSGGLKHALKLLPWMNRLQWFAGSRREAAGVLAQERHWAVLLRALETVDYDKAIPKRKYEPFDQEQYRKLMRHLPPKPTRRRPATTAMPQNRLTGQQRTGLREFELCGDVLMIRFRLLLPLLSSLTRLVLKTSHGKGLEAIHENRDIPIGDILHYCPYLEALHISAGRHEELKGPWFPTSRIIAPSISSFSGTSATMSLPLRSLLLEGGVFLHKDLEDLLAHTPHLKSLKCFALELRGPTPNLGDNVFNYDLFLSHLRSLNLRLDSFFHCELNMSSVLAVYPGSQERTFSTHDHVSFDMRHLQNQSNTITSLDIHCSGNIDYTPSNLLHQYLCSSPHLLHLKALHTQYSLDHMDLHGLLHPVLHSRFSIYRPGIWQCRKLRTLHIRIDTSKDKARDCPAPSPQHSRIAFGYIARVCPELREIQVYNGDTRAETPCLDMSLLGGLCLLGRLQHLERFSTGTWKKQRVLSARNLEWIIESGRSEAKKRTRQKYLQSIWKALGLLDDAGNPRPFDDAATSASLDTKSLANANPGSRFNWTNIDPALREELRYLGLPVEIKAFFDALDKPALEDVEARGDCFPALRCLSLCAPGGIDLPPEREIKRVTKDNAREPWVKT